MHIKLLIDNSTGRDRSRGACGATINTAAMESPETNHHQAQFKTKDIKWKT